MDRLARRIDRWKKKPRFRTPGGAALPALLILALLLVLRVHETAVPQPRPLPAPTPEPRIEPPPVQAMPEPPTPSPAEPVQEGCPKGCEVPPAGCEIKGNISSRKEEKIYHVPGQRWYDKTVISPEKREFWFCTEAEARANGWRKAKV